MSTFLGIDFGERRIGLALSDSEAILATPYDTLDTRRTTNPFAAIRDIVEEHGVTKMVVGYPLHLNGEAGSKAIVVDTFIAKLSAVCPDIPIMKQDERYSSEEAKERLMASSSRRKGRHDKKQIDRVAAAIILQEYLDTQTGTRP